jgi:vancomycin resistance protein YoaR
MKWLGIFALFSIFIQPINPQENLILTSKGEIISVVNRGEFTHSFLTVPVIDEGKYTQFVSDVAGQVYEQPTNAKFGKNGELIQEKVGYRLDEKKFKELFYDYIFKTGSAKEIIPLTTIYPRVDSELLVSIHTKKIGQFMTYYKSANKERSHNIALATEAINNHVVFPGETFSFNKVVGKRTSEKGYLPAPIIIKGELSEGIGGGICQVSSTLFNSVDLAGLDIVQRYSHSKQVPYVRPGRDATVSWYGPDFQFKNTYNQPILIRAFTSGGRCIIMIYSSEVINYKPRSI